MSQARRMVDTAATARLNTVVVQLANGVSLPGAPWTPAPGAWSAQEFKGWVDYARSKGMTVIPEVKFLSQQKKFFENNRPAVMFNKATYDPRNPEVKKIVFRFIDELIALINPKAIHIGHDEVAGHNQQSKAKFLKPGERSLPADLFLADVVNIHNYLKLNGIETWMWADMLITPAEFPGMREKPLHGTIPGYGKALRKKLPRDIVLCDWHYADKQPDFPSLARMKQEGFRVLGATWKKPKTITNFSRYAARHGAEGMIATTWFHVSRKEWGVVNKIIRNSGAAYRKEFPDVR
jgi:hypothetical protein